MGHLKSKSFVAFQPVAEGVLGMSTNKIDPTYLFEMKYSISGEDCMISDFQLPSDGEICYTHESKEGDLA